MQGEGSKGEKKNGTTVISIINKIYEKKSAWRDFVAVFDIKTLGISKHPSSDYFLVILKQSCMD